MPDGELQGHTNSVEKMAICPLLRYAELVNSATRLMGTALVSETADRHVSLYGAPHVFLPLSDLNYLLRCEELAVDLERAAESLARKRRDGLFLGRRVLPAGGALPGRRGTAGSSPAAGRALLTLI